MEFRRPFDPDQRAAAARLYRQYRNDLKVLRKSYPPVTDEEKTLLRTYENSIQEFGREASPANVKVNVRTLNELAQRMRDAAFEYQFCRRLRMLDDADREPD